MTKPGIHASAPDSVLEALFHPFSEGALPWPSEDRALFLRARDGFRLRECVRSGWLCTQSFKPFAEALARHGMRVGEPSAEDRYPYVFVLPPRQRDEARALFARAVSHVSDGGIVIACVPNAEGAKSAEADLTALIGPLQHLSKHKCRVFWGMPREPTMDSELLQSWRDLDMPRMNYAGYMSRPGLFAWDRIDIASALLAQQLPRDFYGRVADLGAGYGFLATQIVTTCPNVTSIDLYEAEARALEPARINLAQALQTIERDVAVDLHWHDVSEGLTQRYDAIVTNPPFHQGRADLPELGRVFIERAADALLPHGRLWLVANRHLPYEATLSARFNSVRTVTIQSGFKVIEATGVRR